MPEHFQGEYYSIDTGEELNTLITNTSISNEVLGQAFCEAYQIINGSIDGQGRYDARVLVHNQ